MKIYEIATGYTPVPARMGAATEIVAEELTRALRDLKIPVELLDIAAKDRAEHDLPIREVQVPGCFTLTDVKLGLMHKFKRVAYSIALAGELKRILRDAREPVVLHFHNQYNLFFFLKLTPKKLRKRCRIAYTVHSYIWPKPWSEIEKTIRRRYFQEVYCVRHADAVLVLNDQTAEHFVGRLGVDPERIHKVRNGVNTQVYRPLGPKEECRAALGLSGKKVILQVGSVCDRKNQLGAVRMLTGLLREDPDAVYVYAGGIIDVQYQEQILGHAKEQGIEKQVIYAGELAPGAELNRLYNAADVTVFPSKLESFGLVILESISAGTPVILAQEPLFALEQGYGIGKTEEAFAALVRNVPQLSCGREQVEARYSWNRVAREHLEILGMAAPDGRMQNI